MVEQLDPDPVEGARNAVAEQTENPRFARRDRDHGEGQVGRTIFATTKRPRGALRIARRTDQMNVLRDATPIDGHAAYVLSRRRGSGRRLEAGEGELSRQSAGRHDSVPAG